MYLHDLLAATASSTYATAQAARRAQAPVQPAPAGPTSVGHDQAQARRGQANGASAFTVRASTVEATDRPRDSHRGYTAPRKQAVSLFAVQRYAQEEAPERRPRVPHGAGAAAYPSLSFDNDILLPGEAVPLDFAGGPRVDITV